MQTPFGDQFVDEITCHSTQLLAQSEPCFSPKTFLDQRDVCSATKQVRKGYSTNDLILIKATIMLKQISNFRLLATETYTILASY